MRLSIIVATYNGEPFIIEQMDSFKNQTRKADEVLFFDDCSTDNTADVIREYISRNALNTWKIQVNNQTKGVHQNFLDALRAASGDIILFSDQDDIWTLDKLEMIETGFTEKTDMLACCSRATLIDEYSNPKAFRLNFTREPAPHRGGYKN